MLREQSPVQQYDAISPAAAAPITKDFLPRSESTEYQAAFEKKIRRRSIHAARAAGRPCISNVPEQKLQQQRKITQHFDIDRGQP